MYYNSGNGFTFDNYDAGLLLDAINRAKTLYFTNRWCWDEMVQRDKMCIRDRSERLTEPPVLQLQDVLSSTYEKFEVRSGDYNWHCKTGNKDEMTGAVACGPGPLDEAMEKERLKLPRYNKLDYVSYTVSWEVMPDRMVVKEYDITDLGNADAEPISSTESVSYTHLDVYKRQSLYRAFLHSAGDAKQTVWSAGTFAFSRKTENPYT